MNMNDDLVKLDMVRKGQLTYHAALFKNKIFDMIIGDMLIELEESKRNINYYKTILEEKNRMEIY